MPCQVPATANWCVRDRSPRLLLRRVMFHLSFFPGLPKNFPSAPRPPKQWNQFFFLFSFLCCPGPARTLWLVAFRAQVIRRSAIHPPTHTLTGLAVLRSTPPRRHAASTDSGGLPWCLSSLACVRPFSHSTRQCHQCPLPSSLLVMEPPGFRQQKCRPLVLHCTRRKHSITWHCPRICQQVNKNALNQP